MDTVFIERLAVPVFVGLLPQERKKKQRVVFDVELAFDVRAAAKADDISKTLDYAQLRKAIITYSGNCAFLLVEALAEYVVECLMRDFLIEQVKLKVTKTPYDIPDAAGVGVIIERSCAIKHEKECSFCE